MKAAPQLQKALDAYDAFMAATGIEPTREQIEERAGVSSGIAQRAFERRRTEAGVAGGEIALPPMSKAARAQLKRLEKRLELEADWRARQEAKRIVTEMSIPYYMELLAKVDRMLAWKRGIMNRAEYITIIKVLHPDTGAHVSDANRNEAFRLFTQYEAKLVDDQEQADLKRVSTLPRTIEELLARKRKGFRA
jgi:hypothetical protein